MGEKSDIACAKILKEFGKLVSKQGYMKTTIRQLCDACQMSPGHISFYYRKKSDIILAWAEDIFSKGELVLNTHIALPDDRFVAFLMHQLFRAYAISQRPDVYGLCAELSENSVFINGRANSFSKALFRALQEGGYVCSREGVRLASICAYHCIYALFAYWHTLGMPLDYPRAVSIFIHVLFVELPALPVDEKLQEANELFEKQDKAQLMREFDNAVMQIMSHAEHS